MSHYQLSKLLFALNRSDEAKAHFRADAPAFAKGFDLGEEDRQAVLSHDIGLLYVLGVNGQILMYFAALVGVAWPDYLQAMRDGVIKHGPVRAGIYAMTTDATDKVAGL